LNQLDQLKQMVIADCLKITEDKSSDNRVRTSDARMIRAIGAASRRGVRSPRLRHHYNSRRRARGPRLNITAILKRRARSLRFNTISVPKRELQDPRPASSQRINAELMPAFQLQMSTVSQL